MSNSDTGSQQITPQQTQPGPGQPVCSMYHRDYKDYSANERTYLSWVRTGVTIIALGFLLEKFELFLASAHLEGVKVNPPAQPWDSSYVGRLLLVFGLCVIIFGLYRFIRIKRALDIGDA